MYKSKINIKPQARHGLDSVQDEYAPIITRNSVSFLYSILFLIEKLLILCHFKQKYEPYQISPYEEY